MVPGALALSKAGLVSRGVHQRSACISLRFELRTAMSKRTHQGIWLWWSQEPRASLKSAGRTMQRVASLSALTCTLDGASAREASPGTLRARGSGSVACR
jgi:hypothetical protein